MGYQEPKLGYRKNGKKAYAAPQMTKHGSVTEITQLVSSGSHGGGLPGGGGGGGGGGRGKKR